MSHGDLCGLDTDVAVRLCIVDPETLCIVMCFEQGSNENATEADRQISLFLTFLLLSLSSSSYLLTTSLSPRFDSATCNYFVSVLQDTTVPAMLGEHELLHLQEGATTSILVHHNFTYLSTG